MKQLIFAFLFGCVLISTCGQQLKFSDDIGRLDPTTSEKRFTIIYNDSLVLDWTSSDSTLIVGDSLLCIKLLLKQVLELNDKYLNLSDRMDSIEAAYIIYKNQNNFHW